MIDMPYEEVLGAVPFCLDKEAIDWVTNTMGRMSDDEKLEQLFCISVLDFTRENWRNTLSHLRPGALMYRPAPARSAVEYTNMAQRESEIPLLIAANLEKGGSGIAEEGTLYASPLEIAATGRVSNGKILADICAQEA